MTIYPKLGNTDFKENKRQNVDDENKPNEKISERFCLDPFSTDRYAKLNIKVFTFFSFQQ